MSDKPQDLKLRTKQFALRIIPLYSQLPKNDAVAHILGKQVLRSGASVGANYREASRARSKAEFTSNSGDCLKKIDETEHWLALLVDSAVLSAAKMVELPDETRQTLCHLHSHPQTLQTTMIPSFILQPFPASP